MDNELLPKLPSMSERIIETMRKVVEQQEAQVRKLALELLGEEIGDPEVLVARLQEHVRKYAGPKASLVLCSVEAKYLPAGVVTEWYLGIDTGEEGAVPVRIGPPYRITAEAVRPDSVRSGP